MLCLVHSGVTLRNHGTFFAHSGRGCSLFRYEALLFVLALR
jgi:hypothetical protein